MAPRQPPRGLQSAAGRCHSAPPLPWRTPSNWGHSGKRGRAAARSATCKRARSVSAIQFISQSCLSRPTDTHFLERPLDFAASSAKSAVSADFLGWITTSTPVPAALRLKRTASRIRRRMRFRSTASPSARGTVNPTRAGPGPQQARLVCWWAASRRRKNTVMCAEKSRRPLRYTVSKSACLRSRACREEAAPEHRSLGHDLLQGAPWRGPLLAKTGLHGDALASLGAAPRQHLPARPGCACGRGSHASWSGGGGWAGMCA